MNKQDIAEGKSEKFSDLARQSEWAKVSPKEFRSAVRRKEYTGPTTYCCHGYVHANLTIVPKDYAFDLLLFCYRNPRVFPVIEVMEPGDPHPKLMASGADLRTDVPKYRVFKDGELIEEPTDIMEYWRDDLVAFLIGCSYSFLWSLMAASVSHRRFGAYTSNVQCVPAGPFHGPMDVGCHAFKNAHDALRAIQITSRHLGVHGPPVHIGDPAIIGIDLSKAKYGPGPQLTPVRPEEITLFWGTGSGMTTIAKTSKVPFIITHCPTHMFVTDRLTEELAIL